MENYIAWNFPNWVTVVLMVAIGMTLVGMASSFIRIGLPSLSGPS